MAYHPALLYLLVALPAAGLAAWLAWPESRPPTPRELLVLTFFPVVAALSSGVLAAAAADLLARRAEPLPLTELLGTWEVYNDSASDKMLVGLWTFEGSRRDDLSLRLEIFEFAPRTLGEAPIHRNASLVELGPFRVERAPLSGVLEFDYSSEFGCGRARLAPAWGFFGTYTDDPAASERGRADTGEILLLREGETAVRRERLARRWVRNHVVLSAWVALAATAFSASRLRARTCSQVRVRAGAGVAFFVTFGAIATIAAVVRDPPNVFAQEVAHGDWHLEYVTDRLLAGSLTWQKKEEGGGARLGGTLRHREARERRIGVSTNEIRLTGGTGSGHRMGFEYDTGRESGSVDLWEVPAMIGPFHDHRLDPDCPAGHETSLNYGDFIAFKRPVARRGHR